MSQENKKKLPYFSDVVLFRRVDKYLDDNIDKQLIDKEAMVDELRTIYKEYQRRNRSAFRAAVFKAYNMINMNIQEVTQERSNDNTEVDAAEDLQVASTPPASYLQKINMMTSGTPRPSRNANNDLTSIDISSDEGEVEPNAKRPALGVQQPHHITSMPTNVSRVNQMMAAASEIRHRTNGDVGLRSQHKEHRHKKPLKSRPHKEMAPHLPAVSIFPSVQKQVKRSMHAVPDAKYKNFGGYPKVLMAIDDIVLHFYQSEVYEYLGISPPRGFILHGPPGCGKTLLAHCIAGEMNLPLVKCSGPELIGGISGESEQRIRSLFQQAKMSVPCVLFIDEIDVISQTRENARKDMERRIVSQLITCLDDLNSCDEGDDIIVIGATTVVEDLDPGLRRAGRFDKEVCIGIPDRDAREGILKILCRHLKLAPDVTVEKIAELTPGYVAADLKALISDSAITAVKRLCQLQVLNKVKSSKRPMPKEVDLTLDEASNDVGEGNGLAMDESAEAIDLDKELAEPTTPSDGKDGQPADPTDSPTAKKDEPKNVEDAANSVDESAATEAPTAEEEQPKTTEENTAAQSEAADCPDEAAKMDVEDGEDAEKPPENEAEDVEEDLDESEAEKDTAAKKAPEEKSVSVEDLPEELDGPCLIVEDSNQSPTFQRAHHTQERPIYRTPSVTVFASQVRVEMVDLLAALKTCQPSAKREGFATVPDVTWDDIGSLKDVREELKMSIMMPVKYPDEFAKMGIDAPSGIMLWGPPGCGKTLLAKAIANEANINFISVKGPELLNMYVGESEKAVRACFTRARNSKPCVIFFDEIDALCPRRSDSSEGSVSSRVVNQVLTEMDGVEGRSGVFLMAASNRPDMIDPAILRPGRLDKVVKVGLPNAQDRIEILKAITKNGTKPPLDGTVSLEDIGGHNLLEGFSGADLAALVKEASVLALTEHIAQNEAAPGEQSKPNFAQLCVFERHFSKALSKIKPSVLPAELLRYQKLEALFS
ncbi:Holliday junction DNA helicase ruvB N-terminus [Nesidiocoris tenuis]|uniref:Holliday junction DNA helicase ruvB N-terminus n=1 Tax=Nesidiocoris tenuis TaxID=355587 RepID=A0ABN7B6L1_9HEMI|nr:Holliday junction DNA helicase ruvB N-terminus [Nesidiocoris tenuis]